MENLIIITYNDNEYNLILNEFLNYKNIIQYSKRTPKDKNIIRSLYMINCLTIVNGVKKYQSVLENCYNCYNCINNNDNYCRLNKNKKIITFNKFIRKEKLNRILND